MQFNSCIVFWKVQEDFCNLKSLGIYKASNQKLGASTLVSRSALFLRKMTQLLKSQHPKSLYIYLHSYVKRYELAPLSYIDRFGSVKNDPISVVPRGDLEMISVCENFYLCMGAIF